MMINSIIFKKIKFSNIEVKNFNKCIAKKGLFVFPAGPGLASLEKSDKYYEIIRELILFSLIVVFLFYY